MKAERIHVQPWGRLQNTDIHSLPLRGQPLISYAPVVYPLGFVKNQNPSESIARALVVADPSGNLPKAREEALIVNKHLGKQYENALYNLNGVEATVEKLRSQLTQVDMFHYAGHGKFNSASHTNSSLILADESKFEVRDILALPRVPESVILSACETAKTNADTPQEGLGIAQAFITAGSQTVVASTRSVEDSLSQFIMTHLYKNHASSGDLALALQQAQTKAAAEYPESDWATFRIITNN